MFYVGTKYSQAHVEVATDRLRQSASAGFPTRFRQCPGGVVAYVSARQAAAGSVPAASRRVGKVCARREL